MRRDRSNLVAGMFVIVGVVLVFGVIMALSDVGRLFVSVKDVVVGYPLRDGLMGLKKGSTVMVGYADAGSVVGIDNEVDLDTGVIVGKLVTVELPAKYVLYENAVFELVVPPLGSGTKLNISSFGFDRSGVEGYQGENWRYEKGDVINGGVAENLFVRDFIQNMGIRDRQREQIQRIIGNIESITGAVSEDPMKIEKIIDRIETITTILSDDMPEITGDVRKILGDVRSNSDEWIARIDSITEQGDEAITRAGRILRENEEDLRLAVEKARESLENIKEITLVMRSETLERVREALDVANSAMSDIKETTGNFKTLVATQRPVVERMVANLRLVSDQLKLTSVEVRRAPWRLLYRPDKDELESDNIYDAARSFAMAASELDSTSESLRVLMDRYGGELGPGDPGLKKMLDNLNHTYEMYSEAEDKFWGALSEVSDK